jgi:hypothetical protein
MELPRRFFSIPFVEAGVVCFVQNLRFNSVRSHGQRCPSIGLRKNLGQCVFMILGLNNVFT